MRNATSAEKAAAAAALAGGALSAGIVNGVIGTGAGTLFYLLCRKGIGGRDPMSPKDSFATAMAAVFPISLLSLFTYPPAVTGGKDLLTSIILPAAAGGAAGAVLSGRIKGSTLKKIFGALVIFGGARMILR